MKRKKTKAQAAQAQAVADIPAEVTLAEVLAEVRRGFASVSEAVGHVVEAEKAVKDRLESIRRILFYIPEVADGVKASQAKKAQAAQAEAQGEESITKG